MSDNSKIPWTDATWGPTLGCLKASTGCESCYAIRTAYRQEHAFKRQEYRGLTKKLQDGSLNWTGHVNLIGDRLDQPLRWKKPRRIFVDSQSDLFHEKVPSRFVEAVFVRMMAAPQHTFQLLTKRPDRMQQWFAKKADPIKMMWAAKDLLGAQNLRTSWPIPNLWLGVSVENQTAADERIPLLLQTQAAVRFVSAEPLLGPVDLAEWLGDADCSAGADLGYRQWVGRGIDWVIVGSESGPHARPMDEQWVRDLRDQVVAAGAAFFYKQRLDERGRKIEMPELDGLTWGQFPQVRA